MPEIAVDEHGDALMHEDNVGSPRQSGHVLSKPQTLSMEQGSNSYLRARVPTPNPRHAVTSLGTCQIVRHGLVLLVNLAKCASHGLTPGQVDWRRYIRRPEFLPTLRA